MYVHQGQTPGQPTFGCSLAFKDLLHALPDGAVVTDLFGNVMAYNRELLNVWGPGSDLQDEMREGVNWIELSQSAGISNSHLRRRSELLTSNEDHQAFIKLRSGTRLAEYSRPLVMFDTCVGRMWCYRPQAAPFEDQLSDLSPREITDLQPQLVFICEREGVNIYFNQSWVDYTGLSQEESRGHGWTRAFHPEDQVAGSHAVNDGQGYEIECRLRRFDGAYRWFLIRALPLRRLGEEVCLWLGTCTDIDDLKQAQTKLQSYQEDLESRVLERTQALQVAIREAQAASNAKSDFLSRMSHELRTPLNAILGFGQLLEMDGLEADALESVQLIVKSGRCLLRLIDEVLDFSKIESGAEKVELGVVDTREVISESLELIQAQAEAKRIEVHFEPHRYPHAYVRADRQRLQQVLANLLSNAVRYNREGGHLWVSVDPDGMGQLHISIRDTGFGFSEEQLGKLFSPFERMGAWEGTGLGLAFAKQLVAAMNGRIRVESEPGAGTTFTVELLQAEEELSPEEGKRVEAIPPQQLKVLAVTDSEPYRDVFTAMLRSRHEVALTFADSLAEAERVLDVDVILIDMDIPGAVPDQVHRLSQAFPRSPLIALSSNKRHRVAYAENDPFFAWSSKSLDPREFLQAVDQALIHRFQAA